MLLVLLLYLTEHWQKKTENVDVRKMYDKNNFRSDSYDEKLFFSFLLFPSYSFFNTHVKLKKSSFFDKNDSNNDWRFCFVNFFHFTMIFLFFCEWQCNKMQCDMVFDVVSLDFYLFMRKSFTLFYIHFFPLFISLSLRTHFFD